MKLTPLIIERFAKFILGGVPFESMKRIVRSVNNEALTGAEKRNMAYKEFTTLGYELAEWMVNLGIELAVAWLKSRPG